MSALSFRLTAALDLLTDAEAIVLDVGADHGLFSLSAAKMVKKIYATENKSGPFQRLKRALQGSSAIPLFSDGITDLPSDVDTLVILGMGGLTIYQILSKYPDKLKQIKTLIIEPQSETELPVKLLCESGYENVDGCYLFEKRYYPLLKFTRPALTSPSERELRYGPYPYRRKDKLLFESLRKELARYRSLNPQGQERNRAIIIELEACILDETETAVD